MSEVPKRGDTPGAGSRLRVPVLVACLWLADVGVAAADEPSHVYGGDASATCNWPSTVYLGGCSGTLIHPEIVMYAGHCGDAIPEVFFGEDFSQGIGTGFAVDTEYCMTNPAAENAVGLGQFRAADFAFCKLAEPVLDVPIVPPLVGCEQTILLPGAAVTLVGFGYDEEGVIGVKREVTTFLDYIDDFGVAVIGGNGQSSCNGDSGGPAFVQLPDGSWRVFGIVSGPNVGECGDPGWYPTSFLAVPFIEAASGIDVTPCHYTSGGWNPSPACRDFPLDPESGAGKAWDQGCGGGTVSEWSSACGPVFDDAEDLVAPSAMITEPADRERFETPLDDDREKITVRASVGDDISGVRRLALVIDGEAIEDGERLSPPWEWNIVVPKGVWELQVVATDWAGNEATSPSVVVGVDEDPPPAPEPGTSSGGAVESSGGAVDSSTGLDPTTSSSGDESTGVSPQTGDDSGCGCRSGAERSGWSALLLLAALGRRRRRPHG